jgi:hypothetical protein
LKNSEKCVEEKMFEDIKRVLLITDMDGTFLPASKIPGKKTLEAVNRFQKAGGRFSIATGRSLQAMQMRSYAQVNGCKSARSNTMQT